MIPDPLDALQAELGCRWPNIAGCRVEADRQRTVIDSELGKRRFVPPDTAFVVVGSLARREWTTGSDLDWMLLVDGQADEAHLTMAQSIRNELQRLGYRKPGPTGVFGGPTFSHELVHLIGGDDDSNRNTTRRVLLLLESANIGGGGPVHRRVILQLLKRYIEDDHGYRAHKERNPYVPRFLLNDIVRYWRTMAVDFAAKRREREGAGWALKRFKLRMSRKLIFSSGLAACLSCELLPDSQLKTSFSSDEDFCSAMAEHLTKLIAITPLCLLAHMATEFRAKQAAEKLFGAYDRFLGVLANEENRGCLEKMGVEPQTAQEVELFEESQRIAEDFQSGLSRLFFDSDRRLTNSVQRYGVF